MIQKRGPDRPVEPGRERVCEQSGGQEHFHRPGTLERHREIAVFDPTVAHSDPIHRPSLGKVSAAEVGSEGKVPGVVLNSFPASLRIFPGELPPGHFQLLTLDQGFLYFQPGKEGAGHGVPCSRFGRFLLVLFRGLSLEGPGTDRLLPDGETSPVQILRRLCRIHPAFDDGLRRHQVPGDLPRRLQPPVRQRLAECRLQSRQLFQNLPVAFREVQRMGHPA